jgi:putative DNA primase/helicase
MPRHIVDDGKWYRCATADKPGKRNGAYLLWVGGQRGYFKNFATDDDYCEWRSDRPVSVSDQRVMDERIRRALTGIPCRSSPTGMHTSNGKG